MEALINQYLPVAVAFVAGGSVKWWNKRRGTRWHVLLSPIVALLGAVGTAMAQGQDLTVDAATSGAVAIALQSLWRGGSQAATGKLGGA